MQPRLSARSLCAGYAGTPVLWDVDIDVGDAEVVAVMGANGAGKTTLLRALSGAVGVRSGSIEMDGRSIVGLPPERIVRLGLAHVLEGRHVFSSLSISENLDLGAIGRPRAEAVETRAELFDIFHDLARLRHLRGGALSGGQQQQLVVARALMSRPRVLLLDEPSVGLSPQLVRALTNLIRTVVTRFETAVVLVEQMVWMATELATRGYVIEHGRVVYEGRLADLGAEALRQSYLGASASAGGARS